MATVITSSNHETLRANTKGEGILKVEVNSLHLGVRGREWEGQVFTGFC